MASRKVSAAQAKAARQKKIAIGGAVLLVGIMVIQGPKVLKLVKGGGSEAAATAPAPVTPVPVTGAPGATPVSATTPAQPGGTKLVSFETFSSKDPFVSQVQAATPGSTTAKTTTSKPATTGSSSSSSSSAGSAGGTAPAKSTPTPFTSGSSSPLAPGTARITVNGKTQVVATSSDFPKADPTFTLVSVGRGTAQIAIAGGSLKAGGKTFTITTAKPTTLLNTASDTQYTLALVSTAPRAT